MRNFIANFVRILGICKDFAGNRVNELGNIPRCGVVPKFSDLEVIALGITAEAFGFDSENLLFHRLHNECKADLPNLISRRQFNARTSCRPGLQKKSAKMWQLPLTDPRMSFASTPNRSKFVKTQEPSAAPWDGIIVRLRPTGAIAHPKVYTTMDISSMLSAEYMVLYILTI